MAHWGTLLFFSAVNHTDALFSYGYFRLTVGDKVGLGRQVVMAARCVQLIWLVHWARLAGSVGFASAHCFCPIPALDHAGGGYGVGAVGQRVMT